MTGEALKSRACLLASAFLFSTGGAAIKAAGMPSWEIAGARSLVAALALLALVPGSRRLAGRRHLLVAFSYALTLVAFVAANKLTTSANAIFLQSTAPLYLLLASPLLLKEPVKRADVWGLVLMAAGMVLLFTSADPPTALAADPMRGNLLATFSGLTWAGVVLGVRWLERDRPGDGAAMVVHGNIMAFLICLPFFDGVPSASATAWATILYMGCIQVALAYVFLTRGLRGVPALEASLLLLFEPALNPLWTWLAHGERPTPVALAGGALIVSATGVRLLR
ncbi:MAG: EamA family transporter [Bryobacterales bacterium]|nr:EamA family transporter [Bryobacterales bacterium]